MKSSIIKKTSISLVRKEYENSSKKKKDYQREKWSRNKSMINRYKLVFNKIKKYKFYSWLDIGCGTGGLFLYINKKKKIPYKVGVDLSPNLIRIAKHRCKNFLFYNKNFSKIKFKNKFDLITMVGLLQKCGSHPYHLIIKAIKSLNPNGIILITSKNLSWDKFNNKNFLPEKNHSWFMPKEICNVMKKANLKIIENKGFLPQKNKIVSLKNSHTFYILSQKKIF